MYGIHNNVYSGRNPNDIIIYTIYSIFCQARSLSTNPNTPITKPTYVIIVKFMFNIGSFMPKNRISIAIAATFTCLSLILFIIYSFMTIKSIIPITHSHAMYQLICPFILFNASSIFYCQIAVYPHHVY